MRAEFSPEHVDQLTTLAKAKGFLGREFLTWLWHTAESTRENMTVSVNGQKYDFDIWVDDRVVLESGGGIAQQNVMKGGDPSQSREAQAALSTGKTVRELKLGMNVKGTGEFTAILHADELSPRSMKLPQAAEGAKSEEMPLTTRLRQMETFLAVLDGLFASFIKVRTAEDWDAKGLVTIRNWIKQRQKDADSATIH